LRPLQSVVYLTRHCAGSCVVLDYVADTLVRIYEYSTMLLQVTEMQ